MLTLGPVGLIPSSSRNIVATVNLDCRLDLKTIALHARNAEYNPKVSTLSSRPVCCSEVVLMASIDRLSSVSLR